MKKSFKNTVCILLCLIIIVTGYPVINIATAASYTDLKYENGGKEFFDQSTYNSLKAAGQLPVLVGGVTVPLRLNGYYLNYRLFSQKNLVVYGNYASIPSDENYFKCGYQIHIDLNDLQPKKYYDGGYFLKPNGITCKGSSQNPDTHGPNCVTTRGEWKYLGFDSTGNLFSNMWMINVKTETKFTDRDWQLEPWKTPLNIKTGLIGASSYNTAAYSTLNTPKSVYTGIRTWIAATVNTMDNFQGIPTENSAYPSGKSMDAYKFMYVQSPPILKKSGSGKMWHDRGGVLWYQTFSIPALTKKEELPVACTVSKISMPAELPNGSEFDSQVINLEFEVTGVLKDDVWNDEGTAPAGWTDYYKDASSRTVKYTRYDLQCWELSLSVESLGVTAANPLKTTVQHSSTITNQAKGKIPLQTTVGKLKKLTKNSQGKYEMFVSATAKPTYQDNTKNLYGTGSGTFAIGEFIKKTIEIPTIEIQNNIGEIAFDSVAFTDASDATNMQPVLSTELYVNGQAVNYNAFFSGAYTFPATTDKNGYFAEVMCKYNIDKSKIVLDGLTDEEKEQIENSILLQYVSVDYVYVYPTKPNAQIAMLSNTWKQNRIVNISNTSASGNIQLVINAYPIVEYRWSYGGDTSKLNYGTNTDMNKQLQYKDAGNYSLTLSCRNTLGKWSDPYTVDYQILEDYSPNIEVNLSDSVLTRNDELTAWHFDVNSTDGDKVATAKIELWYDANNDKILETKVQEWNGLGDNNLCELDDFPKYTPTQLGYYEYKLFAKDEFFGVTGQDTLTQYITDADKKEETYEVEFWVDNYQPLSDVYIDAAIERPNVDLYIMGDKGLPTQTLAYLSDNRVTMENSLLGRNIIPSINLWNMKTYEYTNPASTSSNTGTGYPAASVSYASAGYTGTLPRTSVSDNGGNHDYGYTSTRQESQSASAGGKSTSGHGTSGSSPPSSVSYNSGGWSGTLSGYGYSYTSVALSPKAGDFNWTRSYSGYSGTVYRTVSYWVSDVRWISNYTGYYSGTIYKYVRQSYTNPWRASSSKYVLYISNGTISEIADFNNVISKTDAKIILAGTNTIQLQSPSCAKYINVAGKSTQEILDEALTFIGNETPSIDQVYVLPNQTFTLSYGENDLEGDTIVSREMQYVQDKDYFDNPTGQEPSTQTNFSATSGWNTTNRSSFANVGKYQIYRRVKDLPTGAYGDDYSYYSGATEVDIYVHRKPIALAALDWDFDAGTNTYKTTWIEQSYDLDHNITRLYTDKGIAQRKIMWRKDGGEWNYTIPENLSTGTYNLRYYVKDIENTWSDVFTINIDGKIHSNVAEVTFTLSASPPMQFEAKLRSEKLKFRIPETPVTLPASEDIELYELWSRYPSNPILTMALYNEIGTQVSTTKTVNFTNATGMKTNNDINWNNISFNTSQTLLDGIYTFKITANSVQSKNISFPITLNTPINLIGYINGKADNAQVNTGDTNVFTFTTSKYVNSTQLIFEGKTFTSAAGQIKLISEDVLNKTWTYTTDIAEGAYPDGKLGTVTFKATLPSGMSEYVYVNYKIVGIRAANFIITMMLDIGWRAYYFDVDRGKDDNHDGMNDSYPRRPNTDIGTLKLPVNYFSLIAHTRTYIKAGYKVKGKIDIQGNPDSSYFKISYDIKGVTHIDNVFLIKSSGNTYGYEWIIPLETTSNSYVRFDLVTTKGTNTYGNEKWVDVWDSRNINQEVFYVKGNALDDLTFVQSH